MESSPNPAVSTTDFAAHLESNNKAVRVVFAGRAETPAKEVLSSFLTAIDSRVRELQAVEVDADFRDLKFMNSSCFKEFVVWLSGVKKRPKESQYKIRFLCNSRVRWQQASLYSLSCFAVDLVKIEPH